MRISSLLLSVPPELSSLLATLLRNLRIVAFFIQGKSHKVRDQGDKLIMDVPECVVLTGSWTLAGPVSRHLIVVEHPRLGFPELGTYVCLQSRAKRMRRKY
ncbi:hypothetical protein AVEN_69276-1 [Araneus ventricosus]|uniref:Uncharacterized protein n=1 Tax=Araneus ventricosus TaxID=182803 RepID=A0A4Y2ERI8_ARAVE|nr:hypothetical protein AVEN_69276-1 [Araneus ventricosus]